MKMKKYLFIFVIIAAVFTNSCGLFSSNSNKIEPNKITQVSLRQEWFPYSGYAGEVYAVYETASKHNLQIKLDAGSDQIDPIKLVLSGENDFGVFRPIPRNRSVNFKSIVSFVFSSNSSFFRWSVSSINKIKRFNRHFVY